MIRKCYRCGRVYGEKEPLADKSETHGLCAECLPKEKQRMEAEIKRILPRYFDFDSMTAHEK